MGFQERERMSTRSSMYPTGRSRSSSLSQPRMCAPDGVTLTWFAAEPPDVAASVERRTPTSGWTVVGTTTPDGTTKLVFHDAAVDPGARYAYRLVVTLGGQRTASAEVWVDVPARLALSLEGFRPNPARGNRLIWFTLPSAEPARLEVFDPRGRRMVASEVGPLGPGAHTMSLDPGVLPPGLYWLRLTQRGERVTRRVVVIE